MIIFNQKIYSKCLYWIVMSFYILELFKIDTIDMNLIYFYFQSLFNLFFNEQETSGLKTMVQILI